MKTDTYKILDPDRKVLAEYDECDSYNALTRFCINIQKDIKIRPAALINFGYDTKTVRKRKR